jgi:hypothetical protein
VGPGGLSPGAGKAPAAWVGHTKPLYLALYTTIVLVAPIWITPSKMKTMADMKTAWIVINIEARNHRMNALRLIPAEHRS